MSRRHSGSCPVLCRSVVIYCRQWYLCKLTVFVTLEVRFYRNVVYTEFYPPPQQGLSTSVYLLAHGHMTGLILLAWHLRELSEIQGPRSAPPTTSAGGLAHTLKLVPTSALSLQLADNIHRSRLYSRPLPV